MESELSEEGALRSQFTVDDLDIEILPLIYEIIRRFVYFNNLIVNDNDTHQLTFLQNKNFDLYRFVYSMLSFFLFRHIYTF